MRRLVLAILLLVLLVPPTASADSRVDALLRDACRDEHVSGRYTQREFKQALEELHADADEYTACRQVLENARLAALTSKKGNGGGGGGSTSGSSDGAEAAPVARGSDPLKTASPSQRKAIEKATKTAAPVEIGGKLVRPGALGIGSAAAEQELPTSLIVLIALLGAAVLGGGGWWLWTRVLARRFA